MPGTQKNRPFFDQPAKRQKQPQVEQDASSIVHDAFLRVLRPYSIDAARIANSAFDAGFNAGELTVRRWSTIVADEFTDSENDATEKIGNDQTEYVYLEVLKRLAKETKYLWVPEAGYWRWG